MESILAEKCFDFAIRVVNAYKFITVKHKEFVMSKQLLRSGTSIGANVAEARRGYSRADFAAKLGIALKEAGEVEYWLRLLNKTNYLSDRQYESLNADLQEIINILVKSCTTASQPQK